MKYHINTLTTKILQNISLGEDEKSAANTAFKIIINWQVIFDEKIAKYTSPIKFTTYKTRDESIRTLKIGVSNKKLFFELSFQKDLILDRINLFVGYKFLKQINFVQEEERDLEARVINKPEPEFENLDQKMEYLLNQLQELIKNRKY